VDVDDGRSKSAGPSRNDYGNASDAEQRPAPIRLPASAAEGPLVSLTATVTATTAAVSALTLP